MHAFAQFRRRTGLQGRRKAKVPQGLHQPGHPLFFTGIERGGGYQCQIGIGIGIHFAAPVAADGQQAEAAVIEKRRP